jgi:iron(III) transport system ATP-binding protein
MTRHIEAPAAHERAPLQPAISIRNLTKTFRRRGKGEMITPVNNVSMEVPAGDLVVLLGPSGCGKTTLLRCVAGLEHPDSGEIEIEGRIVFSSKRGILLPPEKRGINMIFQSYALWPHMTVHDNIAYPLRSRKVKETEVRGRVADALTAVGLESLGKQYPSQISGGQQQRVALARAIVGRDPVLLFDEPLSNVDAKVREQLRLELLSIKRKIGFSALYVTHDQHEAMNLATRIAVLDNGRVVQFDTPQTVYDRPSNNYVADFIGAANIIPGRVVGASEAGLRIHTDLGVVDAALGDRAFAPGDNVQLVSRPQAWVLSAERTPGHNCWPVELRESIFSGSHTEYTVRANSVDLLIWSSGNFPSPGRTSAWASITPAKIHVIPMESGS